MPEAILQEWTDGTEFQSYRPYFLSGRFSGLEQMFRCLFSLDSFLCLVTRVDTGYRTKKCYCLTPHRT